MATSEELQARLTEAEGALHNLLMGMSEIEISYEGRTVKYTPTSIPNLRSYIASLQKQLGKSTGRSGAISVSF